jgi:small subunit ribosomal protein S5
MAKTTNPDRHRGRRSKKEPSEYEETTLAVDRVTRVVKGGRRLRFRVTVIVGDKKGKVGMGIAKANEVRSAVEKATKVAKKNMITVPLIQGTIPHEVDVKFKAARIRLLPASEGTGIIAGSSLRVVLDHAGIQNVLSKRLGTNNKLVNAQAVMKALARLRRPHGAPQKEGAASPDASEEAMGDKEENVRERNNIKEEVKKEG